MNMLIGIIDPEKNLENFEKNISKLHIYQNWILIVDRKRLLDI